MSFNRAWIPAVAGIALILGCDSKPVDKIPATAPTAIKEPHEVLQHLQYMAVRKDIKHLPVLDPVDPMATDGAAWWFNSHAGDTGLALTADELKQFGLEEAKDKGYIATVSRADLQKELDKTTAATQAAPKGKKAEAPALPAEFAGLDVNKLDFPQSTAKAVFDKEVQPFIQGHRRALYQAGLWRLLKGIPQEMWPDLTVMETRKDPSNQKAWNVYLGYNGKTVVQLGLFQKDGGTWGLSYWQYKIQPRTLQKAVEASKGEAK